MKTMDEKRREYHQRWREANREKTREASRRWREANPEYARQYSKANREKLRAYEREYYRRNPEKYRRHKLLVRYHLTEESWEKMLADQGGCCYLCEDLLPENPREIHIDHDHSCCPGAARSCGRCIRGLTCGQCNRLIGNANDDPGRLRRIAGNLEARKEVVLDAR